jgi:transcriptional regulator with XRE-family HTH domain
MQQPPPRNALGPTLEEIRVSRGWTLEDFTARLQEAGMTCTVRQLEQIETQRRGITDYELMYLCTVLGMTQEELDGHLKRAMTRLLRTKKKPK